MSEQVGASQDHQNSQQYDKCAVRSTIIMKIHCVINVV